MKNNTWIKKTFLGLGCLLGTTSLLQADEGLWFPSLVKSQKYAEMQKMGMQISADMIYHDKKAGLKDAVVALSNEGSELSPFATASFISAEGLLLTNYHCILSHVERLSNEKNDFLRYGLWTTDRSQEYPCFGLQVAVLVMQKDITDEMSRGLSTLAPDAREREIAARSKKMQEEIQAKDPSYQTKISSYHAGNGYILNVFQVFKDVRIVAAPPMQIGKYAGDYDNWQWPRHTGDFAMLRVYADAKNQPAAYSKDNRPFKPAYFLPISTRGIREGDFSLILGFPSSTRYYVPAQALDKIIYQDAQARVNIREEKLKVYREAIEKNPSLRFRYTTQIHAIENTYLRLKGEIAGVSEMKLVDQKKEEEIIFQQWIDSDENRKKNYGTVVQDLEVNYQKLTAYNLADVYFQEAAIQGADIIPIAGKFEKLMAFFRRKNFNEKAARQEAERLITLCDMYFENWDYELDRQIFRNLFIHYYENTPAEFHSAEMTRVVKAYQGDIETYAQEAFQKSILTHKDQLVDFLKKCVDTKDVSLMDNDPIYKIALGYYQINVEKIALQRQRLQQEQSLLYSKYMQAYIEWKKGELLFPDANQTMRYSYGRVQSVGDYGYQTKLSTWFDKAALYGDSASHYVPRKMRALYEAKQWGAYGEGDDVVLNFISNCQTSSGNSGSPVLNARGEFIGLNFDRYHAGVASGYRYLPRLSRSIAVDARFILFTLEMYSPSSHLLQELKLIP